MVFNISGFVRVKLGYIDILVGVKVEMGMLKLEKLNEGYLEFFVDCLVSVIFEFEGRGGDDFGIEIVNIFYWIFNNKSSVDLKIFCISFWEYCWVFYVDVLFLECGGNLFDVIFIVVKVVFFNIRILRV